MGGAVIVTRPPIEKELISGAKHILGKKDGIVAVSIERKMGALK